MRIRKIEVQGFKSFVDRQTFHFGSGIAGVVGPNGCGKSNVLDAIKWCIGEQSARSLRGAAMQDVIFNGAQHRAPVGMAEVVITFSADGEPFPGQWARYEELSVGRRLYRDGSSEYRIQSEKVRLRDVRDLFLDTGVGNLGYSFIEQGRVEEIVSARPEQRRVLIEEAAGISKYKARRVEALQRLEETEANLARANDVAEEMGRRLRSLEKQVVKAARFRRLRCIVRQGELFLGLARYAALSGERRAVLQDHRTAASEREQVERELARREAGLTGLRDTIQVQEFVLGELRDRLSELEASRRETESARHYQAKEQEDQARRAEAARCDAEEAAGQEASAATEVERLERERSELAERSAALETGVEPLRQAAAEAGRALAEHRRALDAAKDRSTQALTRLARHRTRLQGNAQRQEDLAERLQRSSADTAAAGVDLDALRVEVAGATSELEGLALRGRETEAALAEGRRAQEAAERAVQQRRQAVDGAARALTEVDREVARLEARLQSLEDMQRGHAGVDGGTRAVLAAGGTLGTLAEHLDVPEALEGPLGAALGGGLDHVVVEDHEALLRAVRVAERQGRTGLIAVAGLPVEPARGLASQVGASPAGLRVLTRLLGGAVLAPSLEAALEHHATTGGPAVTPEGTVVLASGLVLAGKVGGGVGQAILKRRREIVALREELEQVRGRRSEKAEAVETARAAAGQGATAVDEARAAIDRLRGAVQEVQLATAAVKRRQDSARGELQRHERRGLELAAERRGLEERARALMQEAEADRAGVVQVEGELATAEAELLGLQSGLDGREAAAVQARQALADVEGERASARARLTLLDTALGSARKRLEEAGSRRARAEAARVASLARVETLRSEDTRLNALLQTLGEEQGEVHGKLEAERRRHARDKEQLAEAEKGLDVLRRRLTDATGRASRAEVRLAELKQQLQTLREQVEERHRVSLPGLLDRLDREAAVVLEAGEAFQAQVPDELQTELPEVSDLRITAPMLEDVAVVEAEVARLQEARARLERLGEVNLAALEEYQETRGRWEWLEQQRQDLEDSVASIREAISQINTVCRERFRTAFDQVDAHFRELYPLLTGGGRSRLSLTDEQDLLESGVEIWAQPPGKRFQSLSLLSGGEKAMTAVALLFALFRVKPSPFCLLDEVDAPLDEGNGARFNEMLRHMSKLSQFIVITHNKKTMEVADTLYGVTMPDPGVSRLVTVRLS